MHSAYLIYIKVAYEVGQDEAEFHHAIQVDLQSRPEFIIMLLELLTVKKVLHSLLSYICTNKAGICSAYERKYSEQSHKFFLDVPSL